MLSKENQLRVRALVRTAFGISIGIAVSLLIYGFIKLGMMTGVSILLLLIVVYVIYDINMEQIRYENKLEEMVGKNKK